MPTPFRLPDRAAEDTVLVQSEREEPPPQSPPGQCDKTLQLFMSNVEVVSAEL